jgi:Endonuclease-reverse transcriptase
VFWTSFCQKFPRLYPSFSRSNPMSDTIVGGLNFLQWNARSLLPKKQHLLDLIREHNIHIIALCETWLQNSDCLYIHGFEVIRKDRPDGRGGGVLLGVRKDIGFRQTPIARVNSCEMIAADLEITGVQGDCLHIASAYFPPDCRLNSVELSAALKELGSPMLIFGDFNAQSQSWGCVHDNNRALVLQTTIDDLSLVFLNDGSLTRIASPPLPIQRSGHDPLLGRSISRLRMACFGRSRWQ